MNRFVLHFLLLPYFKNFFTLTGSKMFFPCAISDSVYTWSMEADLKASFKIVSAKGFN